METSTGTSIVPKTDETSNLAMTIVIETSQEGKDYIYIKENETLSCVPSCERDCSPFGRCDLSTKTCICLPGFGGIHCQEKNCLLSIPKIIYGHTRM